MATRASGWIPTGTSWKHGKHDIKFGYEFRRTSVSQIFNRGFRGTLNFNTQTSAATGLVTATGLQEFLAGTPTGGSQLQGNTDRNTFENSHAGYNGIGPNGRSLGAFRLTATGDVGIGYPFLGSGGPRGLQIAAKISF